LIIAWQGIQGFLPASQLKAEHYPRVSDGDKDKILEELKKFVGQKISVSIISAVPKEGKLIFSEKNLQEKDKEKIIGKYKVGDEVEGEVTGIVDFGVFVKIEEGLEGLVHISEIDWALVEDPKILFKVGQKVNVKIIEIKEGKVSLSIKALKENPWKEAATKYKKGRCRSGRGHQVQQARRIGLDRRRHCRPGPHLRIRQRGQAPIDPRTRQELHVQDHPFRSEGPEDGSLVRR
jgi:small subunit ribosomal protein S1